MNRQARDEIVLCIVLATCMGVIIGLGWARLIGGAP